MIFQELQRGETTLTALAREHGVDHTTIYRWREQVTAGALEALSGRRSDPDVEAQDRIRELERALGRRS